MQCEEAGRQAGRENGLTGSMMRRIREGRLGRSVRRMILGESCR